MSLKRIMNWKNNLKKINVIDKFGKKEKKYALFVGLATFAALNTGFTSQPTSELPAVQPAQVQESAEAVTSDEMKMLIAQESKNLPSGVTISESGSITLAENDTQKKLLAEVVNNTMAKVENVEDMKGLTEGEAVEEPEFVDEVEEVNNVSDFSHDVNSYDDGSQYASVMAMEATAYLPTDGSGAGITAMGIPATYGVAAVDPTLCSGLR